MIYTRSYFDKKPKFYKALEILLVVVIVAMVMSTAFLVRKLLRGLQLEDNEVMINNQVVQVPTPNKFYSELVLELSDTSDVPSEPLVKLMYYLRQNRFNETFDGVGLFCIKEEPSPTNKSFLAKVSALGITEDEIEEGLLNPRYNTAIAIVTLQNLYQESWEQTFSRYVYGETESYLALELVRYCFD